MPSWSTRPKDDGVKKVESEKGEGKEAIVPKNSKSTSVRKDSSLSGSTKQFTKALSESEVEGRRKESTGQMEKESRRQGHYGLLDAVTPRPPPPPAPTQQSSSSSRKTSSLSFTKSAPSSATSKKRGGRRGKTKKVEKKEEHDEDGEWDENGFWKSTPKPPTQPEEERGIDIGKEKAEEEVDELEDTQITPSNKGNGKEIPTSSPSPPPTKLRTPSFPHAALEPQIVDETSLPLPPPQSRLERLKDPDFLLSQNARNDISDQIKFHTDAKGKTNEPLFLAVSLSPDTDREEETEEEIELVESPIQRPTTRRQSFRLDTTDDEDMGPGSQDSPPPPSLGRREGKRKGEKREGGKRQDKGKEKRAKVVYSDTEVSDSNEADILVPDSNPQQVQPARHFGIEITPFVNNSPSYHRKEKSRSSRKTKRYGKGRSHAYQHGNPLPTARSQTFALTPPPAAQITSSYRGAKRKGSTSIWRDSSPSPSPEQDAVDGFDTGHEMGYDTEPPRNSKKRKRWARNGPPPDQRLFGLFGEEEDEPPRYRHKRGRTPKYPFTTVFKWANDENEDEEEYDPDTARRRKKRRRKEIEKRHRFNAKNEPRLQMTRDRSCQVRIQNYMGKIRQTLTLPKKPLHDSKPVRRKAYKRMQGVPLYACKSLDTISYSDYVARYRRSPRSSSSASRPSGNRIDELIYAGRKARFEAGIRRQRPVFREVTPKLPLVPLIPAPDDPQAEDEIVVEPSQKPMRRRGSSIGNPLIPKNVPRLRFTKNELPSNQENTNTNSSERTEVTGTSMLGHHFAMPPSRQNRRREMPHAFRRTTTTPLVLSQDRDLILSDDTPETSARNPQNHYEYEDPIIQYTQNSQVDVGEYDGLIEVHSDRLAGIFSRSPAFGATPSVSPPERLSEAYRKLDGMYTQDMSRRDPLQPFMENVALPPSQSRDSALQPLSQSDATPARQNEDPHQPTEDDHQDQVMEDDEVPPPPSSQINWEWYAAHIPASEFDQLDDMIAQQEEERKVRKAKRSRDTSEQAKSTEVSRQASQTENPITPSRNDAKTTNEPQKSLQEIQRISPHPAKSDSARRMTAMEITQHLLERPLDPSIAQSLNKTFVNTSSPGNSADRPSTSTNTSRKARREERAKRVYDKRLKEKKRMQKEKEKERQTTLNFNSRPSTSRNALAEVPVPSETEEEEEIEEIEPPRQPAKSHQKRRLTLSEAYRNIHPPPSPQPRLKSRASGPPRYSLDNIPVVKNFKDARSPSVKALQERNTRVSQEALSRVFRPPITGIESPEEEDIEAAVYEPTEVSRSNTQNPPSRRVSTTNVRKLGTENPGPHIKAWRSRVDGTSDPNIHVDQEGRERNQGGNPFEENLRMFEPSVDASSVADSMRHHDGNVNGRGREMRRNGKRYASGGSWVDSQDM
ncbi:hypothetical protein I302_104177 [Kwoniella bestiolae CBS 10118]|uniref:Uncharacterized protein n=1 Tax=Kwoniella bestiolae CBS 10118 TaxID=1296100 RepID=A0AAJ8K6P1_9TREE